MDSVVIIYSNKCGPKATQDWQRLIKIKEIEGKEGPLISIKIDRSGMSIERKETVDDSRENPDIIFIKETSDHENIPTISECVEQCLENGKYIYLVVHDSKSKNDTQGNFKDNSVSKQIKNQISEDDIDTDKLFIVPFWHEDEDEDSRCPNTWPLIKNCIEAVCSSSSAVQKTSNSYRKLVDYLHMECRENNRSGMSAKERCDLLLPLAAWDLLRQAETEENKENIQQAARNSIEKLKSSFPELIKENPLNLNDNPETFHRTLQKISTKLFEKLQPE